MWARRLPSTRVKTQSTLENMSWLSRISNAHSHLVAANVIFFPPEWRKSHSGPTVIPMFSCIMSGPPFEMIRYLKALKKMTSPKAKRNNNKTAMTDEHIVISENDKIQNCFQDFFDPPPYPHPREPFLKSLLNLLQYFFWYSCSGSLTSRYVGFSSPIKDWLQPTLCLLQEF